MSYATSITAKRALLFELRSGYKASGREAFVLLAERRRHIVRVKMRDNQLNQTDIRPLIPVVTFIVCSAIASSILESLPWLACLVVVGAGSFAAWATLELSRAAEGRWKLMYRLSSVAYGFAGLLPLVLLVIQTLIAD
jgi:hypothetical protein